MSESSGEALVRQSFYSLDERIKSSMKPPEQNPLRRLFVNEKIILGSTDGTRTIALENDVFARIDYDFVNWCLDVPAKPTRLMEFFVFECVSDAPFLPIFGSTGRSLEELCCTQHQIIDFCATYKNRLGQGEWGTFFLFQTRMKFFIASVDAYPDGYLYPRVANLLMSSETVLPAVKRHRFVFPQQETSAT